MNYYGLFILIVPSIVFAGDKLPVSKQYWQSEAFLKEFNGSYRLNAHIEPTVTGEERSALVSMQKLMAQGKRKAALQKLESHPLAKAKSSAAILFTIGNLLSEEGELEKAIQHYRAAIQVFPSFRRAHQNLAYAYVRQNKYEKAFKPLLEVVRLGGNDGSVMGLLGTCYQEQESYQSALLCFQNAQLTQPDVVEWKQGYAFCLQKLNRPEEALAQYVELEKRLPNSADIKLQTVSLLVSLGQTEQAIVKLDLLRRMEQLEPQNELWLGTLHLEQGNTTLGAETLKRVLQEGKLSSLAPSLNASLNAIRYCLDLGQADLAQDLLGLIDDTRLKASEVAKIERLKAEILLMEQATESEGLAILKKLIQKDPTDVHSQYLIGRYLVSAEKHQEAIPMIEQALIPESPLKLKLYLELVKAQVALKQYEQAITTLSNYLAIEQDPSIEQYREALQNYVPPK